MRKRPARATLRAALHGAFGLDRDLRIRRRDVATQGPGLLVAFLVAGDLDVLRFDFLAEAGDLVGAERVGAGDDAAAVLHGHRDLGVRQRPAADIADEAEIGRALILAGIVIVAEA